MKFKPGTFIKYIANGDDHHPLRLIISINGEEYALFIVEENYHMSFRLSYVENIKRYAVVI